MSTEAKNPDFRMPTASKWSAPRAVTDGGGGTIIDRGGWPRILASLKSLLETGDPLEETRRWPKGF